ncbi:MAG: hypothetical protein JWM58_4096 [Rhizobium sp.]|nr:hypothetical protein [Rhizobium sp.]
MKTRRGTENDDTIVGGGGPERILGLGGNDTITGGGGDDKIWCGDNGVVGLGMWDHADGGAGNDLLYGEDGSDYLAGGTGVDRIFGGNDNDFLFGGNGNDSIYGDAGDDIIGGDKGKDSLFGGVGNDRLMAIFGNDVMVGGKGDDIYLLGRDRAHTTDKSGNDEYHIENGDAFGFISDKTGKDTLVFDDFVTDDLVFTRHLNDLIVSIDGFRGETMLSNFFLNKNNRIETLIDNSDHEGGFDLSVLKMLKYDQDTVNGEDLW